MKKYYIGGAVLVCVILFAVLFSGDHTLTVISTDDALGSQYLNYTMYVPGGKSTCNWSWTESGDTKTFVTSSDGPNGKHQFMYPKDGQNFSNPHVTCLSDTGTTYTGIFPN